MKSRPTHRRRQTKSFLWRIQCHMSRHCILRTCKWSPTRTKYVSLYAAFSLACLTGRVKILKHDFCTLLSLFSWPFMQAGGVLGRFKWACSPISFPRSGDKKATLVVATTLDAITKESSVSFSAKAEGARTSINRILRFVMLMFS